MLLDQVRLVCAEVYEERIQRLKPIQDDILYSREGERFGLAALVPAHVDVCLGQRMMMFRAVRSYDPHFLMWVLNSYNVYQQVLAGLAGSTAPHVNISDIINFYIPSPPHREQKAISKHVRRSTEQLDALVSEAERAVALLKERRAALISAAVTGKIDVRGLVPDARQAA